MARLAHRDGDRERFHFRVGGFDDCEILHAARDLRGDIRLLQPVVPDFRLRRRTHRFRCEQIAAAFRRRLEDVDVAALDAEALQQCMHRILRMVRRRMLGELAERIAHTADAAPGVLVEVGVEARQHHGAMRQRCDRMQEFCGGRHRAGGAGGDHRTMGMCGQPPGFRRDEEIAPRRGLDPVDLGEMAGPGNARDAQEFERVLPVAVEHIRHQAVERAPVDAARHHVVDQACEVAGQRECRGGAADHQRGQHRALGPGSHEPRQRQPPFQLAEPWRNVERRCAGELLALVGESEFVLVDVAERDDARQDHRIGRHLVEKDLAHDAHGAPCRQVQRGIRKPRRFLARLESVDQPAVEQARDDRAQERN